MQVKIIVHLKGRENDFRNIAIELIRRFQNDVGEVLLIWVYILFNPPPLPLPFGTLLSRLVFCHDRACWVHHGCYLRSKSNVYHV